MTARTRLPVPGHHERGPAAGDAANLGQVRQEPVLDRCRRAEPQALLRIDPGHDARRRVERDEATLIDQGDPVREPLGFLHEVGDEDDGDAPGTHALDELPGIPSGLWIETRGQFVEHGDPRVADQRERDGQTLFLPSRELPEGGVALLGQAEVVDEPGWIGGVAIERGVQVECLPHSKLIGQFTLLELDADLLTQRVAIAAGIQAQHADRAGVRCPQPGDGFDGGGLARAVRAEDREDLALLDREGHAVHGDVIAVSLDEVGDFDDVHAPRMAPRPPSPHRPIGRKSPAYSVESPSTGRRPRLGDPAPVTDDAGTLGAHERSCA